MTFAAIICDADDLCSVNTAYDPESSFTIEEVATLLATIETNLRQGDLETGVGSLSGDEASSEWEEKRQKSRMEGLRRRALLWRLSPESMRDGLENIYMLLFRFLGIGVRLVLCNVSWLPTRESVVLVPDPIGFAPWPVLFDRDEPCDSCQDTPHVVASCCSCPMTCHKSTGRATLAMRWNGDVACNGFPKLLNVAGVLMMSTLVSCVQRFSIHDLLLIVVFLFTETV